MGYYIPEENFEQMIPRIELMAVSYLLCGDLLFAHVFIFRVVFDFFFFYHLNIQKKITICTQGFTGNVNLPDVSFQNFSMVLCEVSMTQYCLISMTEK